MVCVDSINTHINIMSFLSLILIEVSGDVRNKFTAWKADTENSQLLDELTEAASKDTVCQQSVHPTLVKLSKQTKRQTELMYVHGYDIQQYTATVSNIVVFSLLCPPPMTPYGIHFPLQDRASIRCGANSRKNTGRYWIPYVRMHT